MASLDVPRFHAGSLVRIGGLVGVLGLAGAAVGYVVAPAVALGAWLTAFCFAVSLALGALLFLTIGYALGAKWPTVVRRLTEALAAVFPVLLLAFIPLVLGAGLLYPWVSPSPAAEAHVRELFEHKAPYLNLPGFALRGLVYFALWIGVSRLLVRASFASDEEPGPADRRSSAATISAAALPLLALSLTFASVDWLMSLDPTWFSSMFGVYYFAGGFVGALGLLGVLTWWIRRDPRVRVVISTSHFHALGRLILGFCIFWAYIAFFQAMLIQIADKPEEVPFYLRRIDGGWATLTATIAVGRFALPFFVLLPRAAKHRPGVVAGIGALTVVCHYLDVFWLVGPAASAQPWPGLIHLAAVVGLGGVAAAYAGWRLQGRLVVPAGDPVISDAIAYRSPL